MKRSLLSSLFCMIAFAFAGVSYAGERVAVENVPQAVVDTVEEYFPGAALLEAERDEKKKGDRYELKIQYKQLVLEVQVTERGEIVEVESD